MHKASARLAIGATTLLLVIAAGAFLGWGRTVPRVVVYCALDREFAEDILQAFTKQTGLEVVTRYDTEANKSVGLYHDLSREASRPRCDVHWNNEILATIRLQREGVYAPYESPAALPYPAQFKAADHTWTAFAARARVLIVNTRRNWTEMPSSITDLMKPELKGRVVMAKPLFGTTATHAACLFQAWGDANARDFFEKLKANDVQIVAGNKQVAVEVGAGRYDVGLTDTDDALAEIDQGRPVAMVFPDSEGFFSASVLGTLFIVYKVVMIKGCPNPDGAKKLIDFLLSPVVEAKLAQGESRQIPLNPHVKIEMSKVMQPARSAHPLRVDFNKAADTWENSQKFLKELFALR